MTSWMILLQLLVSLLRCIHMNNPGSMGIKKIVLWYACLNHERESKYFFLCRGANFVNVALRSFVNAHQTCQALLITLFYMKKLFSAFPVCPLDAGLPLVLLLLLWQRFRLKKVSFLLGHLPDWHFVSHLKNTFMFWPNLNCHWPTFNCHTT